MSEGIAGVSPSLGDAAVLPTITHAGKTWTVGAPTQKAKSAFEDFVLELAVANVERAKPRMSAARWEALNDKLDKQIQAGQYLTWGTLWNDVNSGPDSGAVFLASLLKERHDDATLAVARSLIRDEPRQVKRALARGVPDFFLMIVRESGETGQKRDALLAELLAGFQAVMQDEPS